MNKRLLFPVLALLALFGCSKPMEPVDYVNPYIGNISHLLVPTFPMVHLPNSMLRVTPVRKEYTSTTMDGLPVLLVSHRNQTAFRIRPWSSEQRSGIFTYDYEKLCPYRWSVLLENIGCEVDFAPSEHCAIYSFDFQGNENHGISFTDGEYSISGNKICGTKTLKGATVYFYGETSIPPFATSKLPDGGVEMSFEDKGVELRYAVSFIDLGSAKASFEAELANESVESLAAKGRKIWNEKLSKAKVSGASKDEKSVFYTAIYRTYERPWSISENGRYYSAYDALVHEDQGHPFYVDDWYWDTYRAVHPWRTIVEPDMEQDMLASSVDAAMQKPTDKWLPMFLLPLGDGHSMNANHGIATIADALSKGLDGFDVEAAYQMSKNALLDKTLTPWSDSRACSLDEFYWKEGYFPALAVGQKESVPEVSSFEKRQPIAVTLGTSYDCWCLAQIADRLGKTEDRDYFLNASTFYRNVFNPQTKFFHPKDASGKFIEPFNYLWSGGVGFREAYDENNAWIYRWDVQHDIADLRTLLGGPKAMAEKLDSLFRTPMDRSKHECYAKSPDHSALVGLFSMGNEPCFHIPYLYCYAGEPWKTQKMTRTLLNEWYRNDLMGIPGDEDGGGMSAFVMFSMLGFYPVTPGLPMYVITSPVFEKSTLELKDGKTFTVECENFGSDKQYIQRASLNGKPLDKCWINHSDIVQGGILKLTMGRYPSSWGSENCPPSNKMN